MEPVKAKRGVHGLAVETTYPTAPGLYRLTVTLHTPEGVVYDDATQALLTPVLVRVSGPIAAAYGAPATLALGVDSDTTIAVKVLNAGTDRWDAQVALPAATRSALVPDPGVTPDRIAPPRTTTRGADLVATWVSADGQPVPEALTASLPDEVSAPGGVADVLLQLHAPSAPGTYLILVDVVTPNHGPLSSMGTTPAIIRVTVNPLATPEPSVAPVPAPVGVDQSPVGVDQSPVAVPGESLPAGAAPSALPVLPSDTSSPAPVLPGDLG